MEYGQLQAVADKVNVDFWTYRIQTKVTAEGATVEAGMMVDKRDRKTRKKRWEALEDVLREDHVSIKYRAHGRSPYGRCDVQVERNQDGGPPQQFS